MFVVFIYSGGRCIAQSDANIANTTIQLKGNQVQITYDILSKDLDIRFEVWLEITESNGRSLEVNALTGDIGLDISPGKSKVIMWDPSADSIFLDGQIDIQVFARKTLPLIVEPESVEQKQGEAIDSQGSIKSSAKEFNRTAIIIQSVVLPGLGLSRVTGKPHWIKGILGYGCIGGAILYNKMAVTSYTEYSSADSPDGANTLMDATVRQNNISKGLAFGAIAIWITDITWTIIGTSDLKRDMLYGVHKGVSLGTDYDDISNAPLVSIKYTF